MFLKISKKYILQANIQRSPEMTRLSQDRVLLMNINQMENFPPVIAKSRVISGNLLVMTREKQHATTDRPYPTDSASVITGEVTETSIQNAVIRRVHPPPVCISHVDPEKC